MSRLLDDAAMDRMIAVLETSVPKPEPSPMAVFEAAFNLKFWNHPSMGRRQGKTMPGVWDPVGPWAALGGGTYEVVDE